MSLFNFLPGELPSGLSAAPLLQNMSGGHCLLGTLSGGQKTSQGRWLMDLTPVRGLQDESYEWVITLGYMLSDGGVYIEDQGDLPRVLVQFGTNPKFLENVPVDLHFTFGSYMAESKTLILEPLVIVETRETVQIWAATNHGLRLFGSTGPHCRSVAGYNKESSCRTTLSGVLAESDLDCIVQLVSVRQGEQEFLAAINLALGLETPLAVCPTVRIRFSGDPEHIEYQTSPLLGEWVKVEFSTWSYEAERRILTLRPLAVIVTEEIRRMYDVVGSEGLRLTHTVRVKH
ncbi:hypothetical protein C8J56DRAFT_1052308 [Mycena floridula]|nr:hypothetical protein C8J56DRAFT_1052308 [Mycena floridula]